MESFAGPLLAAHAWHPWWQRAIWHSIHLLLVVGIVTTGVVVFALVLRHYTRRRGRSGRALLSPTGYPLGALSNRGV
jgi:hypothetical protein